MKFKWFMPKSKAVAAVPFPHLPKDPPVEVVTLKIPLVDKTAELRKLERMIDAITIPSDTVKALRHDNTTIAEERTVDKTSLVIQNITKELIEIISGAEAL